MVWSSAHEERSDDAVQTTRLACTCCTCDEQVRSGGEIQKHRTAGNVFADGDIQRIDRGTCFGGRNEVAKRDQLTRFIRHFDTNGGLAGNGSQDAHIGGSHRVRDVAIKAGHLRHLHA